MESQIARIQLFSPKTSNNYVFVMAEKAATSDAELYMVADLPLLNPAATENCEQICQTAWSSLRRSYKRPLSTESFESAIAQINEDLGQLAASGQTHWINKFNCILAVKNGEEFTVSTCGKTAAYLLRGGEFTEISTTGENNHPIKTFDSFAAGKIKLGDILILSNVQLLNFVSMDRLKTILKSQNFLSSAQTIIELLKESAGPEVGFGTILNLQSPKGSVPDENFDLENYVVDMSSKGHLLKKAGALVKSMAGLAGLKRANKSELPKTIAVKDEGGNSPTAKTQSQGFGLSSIRAKLSEIGGKPAEWRGKIKSAYGNFSGKAKNAGRVLSPANIKSYSPAKKYLLIAIVILVAVAVLNVVLAVHRNNSKKRLSAVQTKLNGASKELSLAQSALLYKDDAQAREHFNLAQSQMPKTEDVDKSQETDYQKLLARFDDFRKQVENSSQIKLENLGSLADSDTLLSLEPYLAAQSGASILSFDKSSGKIEDGKLKAPTKILSAYTYKAGLAAVYDGESLYVWNFQTSESGPKIISSVPPAERFVGLAYYSVNNRIYLIHKEKNQIISYLINGNKLQSPVVSVSGNNFSNAQDIAIDGNIYVLTDSGIIKYSAGKLAEFQMPFLYEPYAGPGKLATAQNWQYLYLLDINKKRILVMDKKGELVNTLTSSQFTNLKDFSVDETNREIYVLNGSEIFRLKY